MIIIECKECGFMTLRTEDNILNCPKCKSTNSFQVILEDSKQDDLIPQELEGGEEYIKQITDYILIDQMEGQIKELGHKKCWEIIERMGKAETRYAYRNIFFNAGGKI